jgi:hypothetical protein
MQIYRAETAGLTSSFANLCPTSDTGRHCQFLADTLMASMEPADQKNLADISQK